MTSPRSRRLLEAIVALYPRGLAVAFGIGAAGRYGGAAAVGIGEGLAAIPGLGTVAGVGALGATVMPMPLNAGEDERARQQKYNQGGKGPPMPPGVFPEKVLTKTGSLSDKSAIWLGRKGEPTPLEVIHGTTRGV